MFVPGPDHLLVRCGLLLPSAPVPLIGLPSLQMPSPAFAAGIVVATTANTND